MTAIEPQAYHWLFEGVLQGAPLGIAVFDSELRYLDINQRLAAMHGLPREAHLGRLLPELIPDPASNRVVELMRRVLATGQTVEEVEICYEDKLVPGRKVTCLASYHPLRSEGEIIGVYAFVEDITARRQAELQRDEWLKREHLARERAEATALALGESEERYRTILAALDEGIVVHGRDGGILTANASAERILGLTVDQMAGRTSMDPRWQSIHEDGTPFPGQEHPAMVALRTAEPLRNVSMGVRRPDGSLVWLSVNALPLLHPNEEVPYMVVASFFDVTEFRRAESERARLLREAQEAVRARDEFLTVAAHELRTPLTSLRLHLRMLQRQVSSAAPELGAQLTSRCDTMDRQIDRVANLINALLDVSRLAAGRLSLEPRRMDLAQLAAQLVDTFTSEFQRVGAQLHLRGAGQPLEGVWDPLRVEQVLVNLLSNTVRYGAGKPVVMTLRREGAQAVVTVEDQGIGISEADLARIFGKFERAVSERNYGGLGLGLYITRQLIDAMGGSIEVRSTLGQGSTFTVRLPLEPPPPPTGQTQ